MSKHLRGDYSREDIEKMYKECCDPRLKEKLLALKMIYSGRRVTEVAIDLSVSYKTLYNWIDGWNESGIEGLATKKRGKPREAYLDREEWLKVIEEIKDKGYSLEKVREYIQKTRGVNYSYKGVWAVLREKLKVPYGKPYVLNSKRSPTASEELKKLDEVREKVGEKEVLIGLLDESSVADCSGKSRVINTNKVITPISYRSRRLYSLFGFMCLGGQSRVRATQACKQEDLINFLAEIRSANQNTI